MWSSLVINVSHTVDMADNTAVIDIQTGLIVILRQVWSSLVINVSHTEDMADCSDV